MNKSRNKFGTRDSEMNSELEMLKLIQHKKGPLNRRQKPIEDQDKQNLRFI